MAFSRWFGLALLVVLCCTSVLSAQQPTGRIEGRVLKEGAGVGAVVVLIAELKLTEITDQDGTFAFDAVPVGSYTLLFTLGDNNLTRPVIVAEGQTGQFDIDVDWDIGVRERVTVTAGAARAAKIVDAPAAVTSIPEEQIERQASHGQVPKLLEFTPGAEVTQSGLYDFNFNTRGFNSSLNRRVSTYIDGRDVGVVLLGAQEWAAISGGLDDVANLEFIRGPSAALYGANASSGVVNITTKAPRDSLGTFVRLTGGELETQSVDFRRSDNLGGGWYGKFIAGVKYSGDFSISRNPAGPDNSDNTEDDLPDYDGDSLPDPEYGQIEPIDRVTPFCALIGETDCLPEEKTFFREQDNEIRFGSVRLDKYLADDESVLTFEAGISSIKGPVFQTGIGRVQGNDARRPFFRFNYSTDHWNVLGHYATRTGDQANLTKALDVNFELLTDTKRYGVEAQGNWNFGGDRGRFVIGAAHTEERVDTSNPATGLQTVVYKPISTNRQAIFSQLDWKINDHIKLVFAGRADKNTLHSTQFSPKAAMVYSINPKNSIRFTFNKAFQVANYSEFFLHTPIASFGIGGFIDSICNNPQLEQPIDCDSIAPTNFIPILAVGNDDLELEKTSAFEIGYSGLIANRVFITMDYYNSTNKNFITDLVPQVGTILGNVEECVDPPVDPLEDPQLVCPINADYLPWIGPNDWETTFVRPLNGAPTLAADALRNAVERSVGGDSLGFRLAQDLDGSTIVVGRTYTNIGEVETQGVDLGVQYFVNEAWNLQLSYSWFDFDIIDSDIRIDAILLPNSPEHKASLAVSFVKNRWAASLSGRWVHGFRWSAGVFQGQVADYSTVDLGAGYTFSEMFSLGVNVANLRDSVHRQTFGGDLLTRRALMNLTMKW